MMRAGKRIQKKRRELKLSAQSVATAIEVSRSYLTLIENGQRPLPKKLVKPLAKCFNLPKEVIYSWFLEDQMEKLRL